MDALYQAIFFWPDQHELKTTAMSWDDICNYVRISKGGGKFLRIVIAPYQPTSVAPHGEHGVAHSSTPIADGIVRDMARRYSGNDGPGPAPLDQPKERPATCTCGMGIGYQLSAHTPNCALRPQPSPVDLYMGQSTGQEEEMAVGDTAKDGEGQDAKG